MVWHGCLQVLVLLLALRFWFEVNDLEDACSIQDSELIESFRMQELAKKELDLFVCQPVYINAGRVNVHSTCGIGRPHELCESRGKILSKVFDYDFGQSSNPAFSSLSKEIRYGYNSALKTIFFTAGSSSIIPRASSSELALNTTMPKLLLSMFNVRPAITRTPFPINSWR